MITNCILHAKHFFRLKHRTISNRSFEEFVILSNQYIQNLLYSLYNQEGTLSHQQYPKMLACRKNYLGPDTKYRITCTEQEAIF